MEVILEVWRQVFEKQKQRQNCKVHFCDVIETFQLVYVDSPGNRTMRCETSMEGAIDFKQLACSRTTEVLCKIKWGNV